MSLSPLASRLLVAFVTLAVADSTHAQAQPVNPSLKLVTAGRSMSSLNGPTASVVVGITLNDGGNQFAAHSIRVTVTKTTGGVRQVVGSSLERGGPINGTKQVNLDFPVTPPAAGQQDTYEVEALATLTNPDAGQLNFQDTQKQTVTITPAPPTGGG